MLKRIKYFNKFYFSNKNFNNKPEVIIEFDKDYKDEFNEKQNNYFGVQTNDNSNFYNPNEYISFDKNGLCLLAENLVNNNKSFYFLYFILGGLSLYFLYRTIKHWRNSKYFRMFGNILIAGFLFKLFQYNKKYLKMEIKKIYLNKCGKKVLIKTSNPIFNLKLHKIENIKNNDNYVEKFFLLNKGYSIKIVKDIFYLPRNMDIIHKEVLKEVLEGKYISVNSYNDIIIE